jgi:hypothetical protein
MNRTEWDASNDPRPMLRWLRLRGSDRKFRLFACAAARRLTDLLTPFHPQAAAEIARNERVADGAWVEPHTRRNRGEWDLGVLTRTVAEMTGTVPAFDAAWQMSQVIERFLTTLAAEDSLSLMPDIHFRMGQQTRAGASLIRDLFGHLFHTDPLWLARLNHTDEVERIARAIYDDHSFTDMPILADALEDAGCLDAEVLAHCRDGGEHARGCWVIDSILGKS